MDQLCYQSEPEQTLFFDLPNTDRLRIKGILRGNFKQPIAIIMHGRPGTGNELLPYLAARYLYQQGIASLRLFMYDFEPNTRDLLDCTLETHVADFNAVVAELRKHRTPKVYGIGHSYGGCTILLSKVKLDAAVLWDPTHFSYWDENDEDENFPKKVVDNIVIGTGGYGYIYPLAADKYDKSIGDNSNWAANKGYPLKIISAQKGAMSHLHKKYIAVADEPKEQVIIKDAHHQLEDSDEVVFKLLQETGDWLKKY